MLKYICSLLLLASCCVLLASGGTFTTPPTQIDPTGYTAGVRADVFCCYNSLSNQIVFSWPDLTDSQNPWYCIYDVKTSSFSTPPTQIDPVGYTAGVRADVFCCYNSANNQIVFSWGAATTDSPWYCIYDVKTSSFSTQPTQIDPTGYTQGVEFDVISCYNSGNNQIVFSWADLTDSQNPWYCIYDVKTSSFSTLPTQIDPTGYTQGVASDSDVVSCYNSSNNHVVFSWAEKRIESVAKPWYCIYDVTTNSFSTQPTPIDSVSAVDTPYIVDVFCCYNSVNNQVVFSWRNRIGEGVYDNYNKPWYCIYDVTTNSFSTQPTQIDPTGYTAEVLGSVYCCYNSANNQVFFSWNDRSFLQNAWYCIYDAYANSFSTPPTQIDPTGYTQGVLNEVFSCYNSTNNQIFFSWGPHFSQNPWYAIYTEPFPPGYLLKVLSKYSPMTFIKGVH